MVVVGLERKSCMPYLSNALLNSEEDMASKIIIANNFSLCAKHQAKHFTYIIVFI